MQLVCKALKVVRETLAHLVFKVKFHLWRYCFQSEIFLSFYKKGVQGLRGLAGRIGPNGKYWT